MSKLNFDPFYQDYLEVLNAYGQAIGTIYTDQYTIAPKKGAADASQVISILSRELLEKQNNPEMIAKIEAYYETLPEGSLEKEEIRRRLENINDTRTIPPQEYADFVKAMGDAQTKWLEAKEAKDYEQFKPYLKDLIEKQLHVATYSPRYNPEKPYDAMLDQYEKGMNEEKYDEFFEVLREEIPPVIKAVGEAEPIDDSLLSTPADVKLQEVLSEEILDYLQADRGKVYLSTTEHPFTNFLSHNDVRITTHYYPDALASAVLSTIHEYGHALYALQMDEDYDKTELANPGMASHESQSRFLENHIGRSLSFWKAFYPKLQEKFPAYKDVPVEEFVRMLNASKPGLIRTEADELTYPMHILVRYDLEKQMANGTLDYDKLPELWADKYEEYLGIRPENDAEGVLQDMHWSAGNFGYFPTYALGSAYAVQLYEAMAKEIDVDKALEEGNFQIIQDWLRDNVQAKAATKTMAEIVEEVSGKPFDPHVYTNYLKDKYSRLYNLNLDE